MGAKPSGRVRRAPVCAALSAVADRYGLIRTGGSDYHGEEDKPLDYRPSSATLKMLGVLRRG